MIERVFRSNFYKKIAAQFHESQIKINCENEPEITYDLKDIIVESLTNDYNIDNKLINVVGMKFWNINERIIDLECGNVNSYFSLKQDFSNIFEILDKFNTLIKLLPRSFEWSTLIFKVDRMLNYIEYCELNSVKYAYVHTRNDFKDFNTLEKYDFIIMKKATQGSSGKIVFDGESLETDSYIIEFIKEPTFDKFIINLDNKIDNVIFGISYDLYPIELISHYMPRSGKYIIYFGPSKVEHFSFLRLLSDASWLNIYDKNYTETELLIKMYNI